MESHRTQTRQVEFFHSAQRIYEALVWDENQDKLTRVKAPSRRVLNAACDALFVNEFVHVAFQVENGKVTEEWGDLAVPIHAPVDQEIWVD